MRYFIIFFLLLTYTSLSYADNSARIKIKITGYGQQNKYFLCIPGIGCLSIKAAAKGKIFPIFHSFEMDSMYLLDASQGFKVHFQGLPASCNKTVNINQTITISGSIFGQGKKLKVSQLHCSIN